VRTIQEYDLIPLWLTGPFAALLMAVEAFLAATLIAGRVVSIAAVVATGVLFCSLGAVSINLHRGRKVPCGCFGRSDEPISTVTAARLGILLAGSATLWAVAAATSTRSVRLAVAVTGGTAGFGYIVEMMGAAIVLILASVWILESRRTADLLRVRVRRPGRARGAVLEEL